jgi:tRNA(Ile)-lysidine synthase
MLTNLGNKVADFIKANELFQDAAGILLAVSGGADSIALLYVMHLLKKQGVISGNLCCAHINHRLRAEQADKDEEFVVEQAAKLGLSMTNRRIDVRVFARRNKISIETAAREIRIESLINIAAKNKCSHIVTGHQKDDNAETVLHRLLRGTGFRGLAGIWPMRTFNENIRFVRPLLCVTRDEISKYLQKNKLKWREDATNIDCRYTRNYIRHKLLPTMQKDFNGSIVEQLYEISNSARRCYKIICSHVDNIWPQVADCKDEKVTLNLRIFSEQSPPVKIELIRRSLCSIGCGESGMTEKHYRSILQLAEQNVTGKMLQLPGGFIARREYGNLVFSQYGRVGLAPPISYQSAEVKSVIIKIPGRTRFRQYSIEATLNLAPGFTGGNISKLIECFDLDKFKPPVFVRLRRPGDRFIPLGQKGEIKIGKFLTAQKVTHEIRQNVLVIADVEKIIWLWPVRISEQVKVTNGTNNILQLEITDSKSKE